MLSPEIFIINLYQILLVENPLELESEVTQGDFSLYNRYLALIYYQSGIFCLISEQFLLIKVQTDTVLPDDEELGQVKRLK